MSSLTNIPYRAPTVRRWSAAAVLSCRRILDELSPVERSACLDRFARGHGYARLSADLGDRSPDDVRRIVSHTVGRLLEIIGEPALDCGHLADLLDRDSRDAQVDELQLLAELRELVDVAAMADPPTSWGKFHIVEPVATGGFGTVYRVRDPDLDQDVALKLYHPHRTIAADREGLLSEARKLARVRHPHVVRVYGADEHDGRVGVWMELIDGDTIEAEIESGRRFDAVAAADLGIAICEALSAAHAAGLAHGDVTARNVMCGSQGHVMLTDFGAARFHRPEAVDPGGALAGTPAYMAPERFIQPLPTVQSDLYAVGVLLFYAVTGHFPVVGDTLSEIRDAHHRCTPMQSFGQLTPKVSDAFARVVETALARSPDGRWLTAEEMGAQLRASKPAEHRPMTFRRVVHATTAVAAVTSVVWMLGFIPTRALEVLLQVDREFLGGTAVHLRVGREALIPLVLFTSIAATIASAVMAVVIGISLVVAWYFDRQKALGTPAAALFQRWSDPEHPTTAAAAFLLVSLIVFAGITWTFLDVTATILSLDSGELVAPSTLSTGRLAIHVGLSGLFSFVVGLAAWLWFPRLERRVGHMRPVRLIRAATVAVALMALATATLPRRIVWERFEEVRFDGHEAVVVGARGGEVYLIAPWRADGLRMRVPDDDPRLERLGTTRLLLSELEPGR